MEDIFRFNYVSCCLKVVSFLPSFPFLLLYFYPCTPLLFFLPMLTFFLSLFFHLFFSIFHLSLFLSFLFFASSYVDFFLSLLILCLCEFLPPFLHCVFPSCPSPLPFFNFFLFPCFFPYFFFSSFFLCWLFFLLLAFFIPFSFPTYFASLWIPSPFLPYNLPCFLPCSFTFSLFFLFGSLFQCALPPSSFCFFQAPYLKSPNYRNICYKCQVNLIILYLKKMWKNWSLFSIGKF